MINWKLILPIARTHLFSKLKQTSIAALGVTFGIGSYITLVSFMTGLNTMLDDLIINQTPHIHIYNEIEPTKQQPIELLDEFSNSLKIIHSIKPKFIQKKIHNAEPLLANLNSNKAVKGAVPQVKTQILYISGSIDIGGNLTGIEVLKEVPLSNFREYITQGSPEALANTANGILLGAGIAKKMSLGLGERVQIQTVNGDIFPLKIVGIYQSGIADIDNIQSFANLNTVQRILGEPEKYITDINVKLNDIEQAAPMAKKIEKQHRLKRAIRNGINYQKFNHLCRLYNPVDCCRFWDL